MPYKLIAPIEKVMILEETDRVFGNDGNPTTITIRQASQREQDMRDDVNSQFLRRQNDQSGQFEVVSSFSYASVVRMEIYLTMADCNILDEEGKQLFRFRKKGSRSFLDMNTTEFAEAYGMLDPVVAKEIHDKVLEININWDPTLA